MNVHLPCYELDSAADAPSLVKAVAQVHGPSLVETFLHDGKVALVVLVEGPKAAAKKVTPRIDGLLRSVRFRTEVPRHVVPTWRLAPQAGAADECVLEYRHADARVTARACVPSSWVAEGLKPMGRIVEVRSGRSFLRLAFEPSNPEEGALLAGILAAEFLGGGDTTAEELHLEGGLKGKRAVLEKSDRLVCAAMVEVVGARCEVVCVSPDGSARPVFDRVLESLELPLRSGIVQYVRAELGRRYPAFKFKERGDELRYTQGDLEVEGSVFLDNAEAAALAEGKLAENLARHVEAMRLPLLAPGKEKLRSGEIFPALCRAEQILSGPGYERPLVFKELGDGLVGVFAVEREEGFFYATADYLASTGLALRQARVLAALDLGMRLGKSDPEFFGTADGQVSAIIYRERTFAAAAIALKSGIPAMMRRELGPKVCFAVPSCHDLIAFDASNDDARADILELVAEIYGRSPHPLSRLIYEVEGEEIREVEFGE